MIERKFVNQKIKEFEIKEYIKNNLSRVGLSDVKLQRTPLGEKIIISTSRPGLVVGRSGANISKLTKDLKTVFGLENPQIEIDEVGAVGLDANIISEMIANSLEKFGIARFKGIGHKAMQDVMNAGALGVEIVMSGKIPSARARSWRFNLGYLKKCGDIAVSQVKVAFAHANLKSGTVGIKVSIMTPDIILPDQIKVKTVEEEKPKDIPAEEGKIKDKVEELLKDESIKPKEEQSAKKEKQPKADKKEKGEKKEKKPKKAKEDKEKKQPSDSDDQPAKAEENAEESVE
jgi:small subunit ribosomal protein S3